MLFRTRPILGSALLAAMLILSSSAANAAGVQTFSFTGLCFDCSGTATGVLTLLDTYVPGDVISLGDFVSFDYNPTDLLPEGISFTAANVTFLSGSLPASLPGTGAIDISVSGPSEFFTTADGHWYACPNGCGDFGNSYT